MDTEKFIAICKRLVRNYVNGIADKTDNKQITLGDVYMVWHSRVLKNNKALMSTNLVDGMYYEITYNGDKNEIYFDAYKKWENKCFPLSE